MATEKVTQLMLGPTVEADAVAVTTVGDWEAAIAIPTDAGAIELISDVDVYVSANQSGVAPTKLGRYLTAGVVHRIYCYNCPYLWFRRKDANAAVAYSFIMIA